MTTTTMTEPTTYAIFAPEANMQDQYGRKVRGMLMHVTQAETAEQAFADFDDEVGASGTTADDHFIEEVPAHWLDTAHGPYDYDEDEIL